MPLWAVGGPVRDLAVGLPVRDLDLATPDPAALAEVLAATLDGRAHVEPRFGTASVTGSPAKAPWRVDLAALRTEHYVRPGALPTVRLGATIEADLARRDFTVNAVALALTAEAGRGILDPFGGLDDLAAGRLRVLHAASFRDDATRLWRAARFAARLRLRPDTETARCIAEGTRWLDAISARRLWREFALVAAEPRATAAVRLLDRWGILAAAHPALALDEESRAALGRARGPLPAEVLLALLLAGRGAADRAAAVARLGAPRDAARAVEDAAMLLALPPAPPPAFATLEAAARSIPTARAAVRLLDLDRRPLLTALARWERTSAPLAAAEVAALGIAPDPRLGAALAELRRARYVGTLSSAPAARALVRRWAAEGLPTAPERIRR
ncbi:MAG: hypothetical protein WC211_08565 [Dehalococcoidia bacterium]